MYSLANSPVNDGPYNNDPLRSDAPYGTSNWWVIAHYLCVPIRTCPSDARKSLSYDSSFMANISCRIVLVGIGKHWLDWGGEGTDGSECRMVVRRAVPTPRDRLSRLFSAHIRRRSCSCAGHISRSGHQQGSLLSRLWRISSQRYCASFLFSSASIIATVMELLLLPAAELVTSGKVKNRIPQTWVSLCVCVCVYWSEAPSIYICRWLLGLVCHRCAIDLFVQQQQQLHHVTAPEQRTASVRP